MRIGFTGTQNGMTREQRHTLEIVLKKNAGYFHHGDCIGADEQAHQLARRLGYDIWIHPPESDKKRAYCETDPGYMMLPRSYLVRNQNIVGNTELLIACPNTRNEELRSGTWSTVRYARKMNKPIKIILPNGKVINEK